MNSKTIIGMAVAVALAVGGSNAAQADDFSGAYAGASIGVSGVTLKEPSVPSKGDDSAGGVVKLFGGYQFNRYAGVEGAYVRSGNFTETRTEGAADIRQMAQTHAWYVAGKGSIPISEAFAFTGKLGVAFGDVDGDDPSTSADDLYGHRASLLAGLGMQYRLNPKLDLLFDLEDISHVSRRLSVGMITLGVRKHF